MCFWILTWALWGMKYCSWLMGVAILLLWYPPISYCYQTCRGRGFGGQVRGPLLQHTRKKNIYPLSVTWMWLPSQEPHLHRVLTCFIARLCLRLTLIHTLPVHSLNLRDMVSSWIGLLGCLWEVIRLPFCFPKAGLLFEPRFLTVWLGNQLVPKPFWVTLCNQDSLPSAPGEMTSSIGSTSLLAPGEGWLSQGARDVKSYWQVAEKHCIWIPDWVPRNVVRYSSREQDAKAFWKQCSLAWQQCLSGFTSKCWAWRTKGPWLTYPCKQITETRSKV
jgi:hypothetical protein